MYLFGPEPPKAPAKPLLFVESVLLLAVVVADVLVVAVESSAGGFSGSGVTAGLGSAGGGVGFGSSLISVSAGFGATTSSLACFLGSGFALAGLSVAFTLASPRSLEASSPMPICALMSILKFWMSPLYFVMVLSSQIQISLATCEISRISCETSTIPPSNSFTALANASILSMSCWCHLLLCCAVQVSPLRFIAVHCSQVGNPNGIIGRSTIKQHYPKRERERESSNRVKCEYVSVSA
mmetsp:Transcript_5327/g.14400  ORF Transcript_5327/g.14400 Transcript_5327/m.14400 type:complete len:239 (-) Transcript_5327:147-863(-)